MGVTSSDIQLLEDFILAYDIKSVIELGAQNNFSGPGLPAPYMSDWWKAKGVYYESIDISAENSSIPIDLSKEQKFENHPFKIPKRPDTFDLVTDFGTSEHIGVDGKFDWVAIYHCWKTKFNLCKIGGIIISENPKTGNWPGHGFQYYTKEFYIELSQWNLDISILDEVCAMDNCKDGKNILCVMQKTGNSFPDLEIFKGFDLRQS